MNCDHAGTFPGITHVCTCNQMCCWSARTGCVCGACNCDQHHTPAERNRQPRADLGRRTPAAHRWPS